MSQSDEPHFQAYKIGQSIKLAPRAGLNLKTSEAYTILAVLPERNGEVQYRVRSAQEPHDRMVLQGDIADNGEQPQIE